MLLTPHFLKHPVRIKAVRRLKFNDGLYDFDVARFDETDPLVSGNKLFKLYFQIEQMRTEGKTGILTMGGAFSNHLIATAAICKRYNIPSAGIVRGEATASHTLEACREMGMELFYVSRSSFEETNPEVQQLRSHFASYHFIPPGGDNDLGEKGAAEMSGCIPEWETYTHLFCAIGTGTTFRGLQHRLLPHQFLHGIPAVKIPEEERSAFVIKMCRVNKLAQTGIYFEAAGKGFGKKEQALFMLMNEWHHYTGIPTDFIYTAKAWKGMLEIIANRNINPEERCLLIHTGGLQGNLSLSEGTLSF